MKRIAVCITARPSYSRVKSVLSALKARKDVTLQIVAAASALVVRYGRVVDQIRADGFEVTDEVPSVIDGDTTTDSALSTGLLLSHLAGTLSRLKPDMVVTIADRHETLATAIAASYQNIPLCHIQGGEVSGSIDDRVRYAVTQLADLHCVATEAAFNNVKQALRYGGWNSGTEPDIPITGCPSIDLAHQARHQGKLKAPDVVVLQHAVTTESDQAADQMRETIKALRGMDVLWFWPGEDAGNGAMAKVMRLAKLKPTRSLEPVTFLRTLMGAKVLVGNSSVGIRECSYLGVPVVNVGTRQNGRERAANVTDVGHDAQAIRLATQYLTTEITPYTASTLYGDGHAGERIASILAGEQAKEGVA